VYKIIREENKTALLITHDISEAISVADKIFVLSKRPATIIAEHAISFPESEPLKRRENQEFSKWFEILWEELNK
jgi:NitT/TauT family transport system ATP-binding protein